MVRPLLQRHHDAVVAALHSRPGEELTARQVHEALGRDVPEHTVWHLRFRKSLAWATSPDEYHPESLRDLAAGSVRTVFVVHGPQLVRWLEDIEMGAPTGSTPWENARHASDAMGA